MHRRHEDLKVSLVERELFPNCYFPDPIQQPKSLVKLEVPTVIGSHTVCGHSS